MNAGEFDVMIIFEVTLTKYEGALLQHPKSWGAVTDSAPPVPTRVKQLNGITLVL